MSLMHLKAMLGDYPITHALNSGQVSSPDVVLDFTDVALPQQAFKRVDRDLEFDVAELAIVTFLLAKSRGVPISLIPAVMTARFQHPYIVYNAKLGKISPHDLSGLRIGIRSWTVTTVTWLRAMLEKDYGADLSGVKWITFEDAHVLGFTDPEGATRASNSKTLEGMLKAGEMDAAIVGAPLDDSQFPCLFPDPAAAAAEWRAKHNAIQINHMVAVKDDFGAAHPGVVRAVYRMLEDSKAAAGVGATGADDMNPFGIEANRHNLEVAINYVHGLGFLERKFSVDELFHEAVR